MTGKNNNAMKTGAGLAALAAAAAGAYYFFGKDGKQHQKRVTQWAKRAKQDVIKELKKLETVSKPLYEQAVSRVMEEYKQIKSLKPDDVSALGKELKSHWNGIAKEIKKAAHATAVPNANSPKKKKAKK